MGLFEFRLKRNRKIKDAKIAKVQQHMQAGEFEKAGYILHNILVNPSDFNPAYRFEEMEELLEKCKEGAKNSRN